MRCVVVGAGAWGLPAAAELAARGHAVILVDRYGVANRLSSSPGPTRLWRLTHPDAVRVRLAQGSLAAMERLAERSGRTVFLRRGLLWRDDAALSTVVDALTEVGVPHELVPPAGVDRWFPGLRPDHRGAVWSADAGPVLAAESMTAQADLFTRAGGATRFGAMVREVSPNPSGVRVSLVDGTGLDADVVVLAPGPGAAGLLPGLGVRLPLRTYLEQVVHFGQSPATDDLPCLYDGPVGDEPAMYTMPTPGIGYKVGLDRPLRIWTDGDDDRTPDPGLTALAAARVGRRLTAIPPVPGPAQVCCWTESPDGRFVIDTLPGGVVLACGDSGEGFKFSALMGIVLADLAEGRRPDPDVASFALSRFPPDAPLGGHVLGR